MKDFDAYLESQGFQKGAYLSPETAQRYYTDFSGSNRSLNPAMFASRGSTASAQQSGGQQGGMGMLGGIAGGMLKGQGGGGNAGGFGGSVAGIPGGAISGAMAGHQAAKNDPDMSSGKDGFGKHWRDSRAEVGGAVAGGVMGYYGLGALAGPAVTASHPFMEPTTRALIKFGDSWGGAGGALMMDPIGTVASGKYSAGDLVKGALLGPLSKYV